MLLKQQTLEGIARGSITTVFRRWKRPTVKAGGTLLTGIGQLGIRSVRPIQQDEISDSDVQASGYRDRASLLTALDSHEGDLYRIELHLLGPDPRVALRESVPNAEEVSMILTKLSRMDTRSTLGPWTADVLRVIATHPKRRAADLAEVIGMNRDDFKPRVRRLKALGLTESLGVGYRLSPRGEVIASAIADT